MLRKRVITGLWGIPLLAAIVWFGEPWFTIMLAAWGVLAALEFFRLVAGAKVPPLTYFGLAWTVLFILSGNSELLSFLATYFEVRPLQRLLAPLLFTAAVILPLIWYLLRSQKERIFARWAWTVAGILYVGWLLSHLVALRGFDNPQTLLLDEGRNWVFFALFVNFASDTAAFFVGRALGRHHLAPRISPGKTWEGAIAGIVGAIIVGLLFILSTPLHLNLHWGQAVLLGFLVSIFGQLGDLLESWFKRRMGVKDSGNLIPGHGGILDRMDSVVFAGIVVYYYVVWMIL